MESAWVEDFEPDFASDPLLAMEVGGSMPGSGFGLGRSDPRREVQPSESVRLCVRELEAEWWNSGKPDMPSSRISFSSSCRIMSSTAEDSGEKWRSCKKSRI